MRILFTLLITCMTALLFCQTIQLHSVKATRQSGGDNGYTLDGTWMQGARLKLNNPASFGPGGIYPKSVVITDAYDVSGSLSDVTSVAKDAIFFFGNFDMYSLTEQPFTDAEIESLYQWSLAGGKVIILSGLADINGGFDGSILNTRWGFLCEQGAVDCHATPYSASLFNGPFGNIASVNQTATMNDHFVTLTQGNKVFATSSFVPEEDPVPSLIIDCTTLDLIVADRTVYTIQGGITGSKNIQSIPDKFWANTIAFMDKLQGPPELVSSNDSLSVGTNYVNYQWYKDGAPISGANSPRYNVTDYGIYHVETTVNGGCILKSKDYPKIDTTAITDNECDLFVPTAFSPDNNGVNDKLCMYGKCFKDIEFKVFDRWGEMVFDGRDRYTCWDGTYKGEKSNSGVYVWSVKATRPSGTTISRRGSTTLIRR